MTRARPKPHVPPGKPPSAWGKVSPEAVAERAARAEALRDAIAALETDRTTDQAILERLLAGDIDDARYDAARIPFTGDWGFQAEPIFAAMQTKITTEAEGDAWISRLNDVPRYFAENVANMRRGLATGWMAHADPLKVSTDQIREQIFDDPSASGLYVPFLNLPADMDPAVASRLKTDGLTAVANAISAYRKTLAFIEKDYAPNTRGGAGIAGLPGGKDVYAAAIEHHTAGAGYSPEEIHALGEAEVARIRSEMEAILEEIRFEGDFQDFLTFLRTDPAFYAKTPEELMSRAKDIAAKLDAILPDYFGKLPEHWYDVEPVPAAIAPGYTSARYVQGDPEEGRRGTYLVNTYALDQRPLYELPALSAARGCAGPPSADHARHGNGGAAALPPAILRHRFRGRLGPLRRIPRHGGRPQRKRLMSALGASPWKCGVPAGSSPTRACTGMAGHARRPRPVSMKTPPSRR